MSKNTTPSGQPLTQFLTPRHGFNCDACGTILQKGVSAYGNRAEDYDVCSTCFGANVFGSGAAKPGGFSFGQQAQAQGFGQQAEAPGAFGEQASVGQTMLAINMACKARGGAHAGYSCKTVSWDDAARGTVGGCLSSWGSNITDTYLKAKDGTRLFTVRLGSGRIYRFVLPLIHFIPDLLIYSAPQLLKRQCGRTLRRCGRTTGTRSSAGSRPPRSHSSRATRPRAARPWRRSPSVTF